MEGRWRDTPILQGEGRQRCSAQSPDQWQELLPRPEEETAPSPSLLCAGNLGTAWPGRWGGLLWCLSAPQGLGLCMSQAKNISHSSFDVGPGDDKGR